MNATSEISYPPQSRKRPDSGLTYSHLRKTYLAAYHCDGKRRTRTLGTRSITEARALRTAFYAELAAAGATETKRGRKPGLASGIYPVKAHVRVIVGGVYVGSFGSTEEAVEAKRVFQGNVRSEAARP